MLYTQLLTDYVNSIRFCGIPDGVSEMAKMCVADLIGVAISGSAAAPGRLWHTYFAQSSGNGATATAWNCELRNYDYHNCAGLNAAYSHLLDMDDVHSGSITHLGAVTIPAALAVGQKEHSGGQAIIEAIVAGYEVGARIGEAVNPESYRYWHTTGIVAPFSSAVAAGKLIGLSNEQMLNAMGSAGTQASGLWEFLTDGAMSKALHTANGTLCGIRSAETAKLGITGARRILEGEQGLVRAINPNPHLEVLTEGYHRGYRISENSFKKYPCCRHTHSAVYCAEKISAKRRLRPKDIAAITGKTYGAAAEVADRPDPGTPYEAKFSLQYCIASMLLHGSLDEGAFTREAISAQDVRDLMKKVRIECDPQLEQGFREEPTKWTHILEVELADGERITERTDYPPGDFKEPFGWETLWDKFLLMTAGKLTAEQAGELFERICRLERLNDINELFLGIQPHG